MTEIIGKKVGPIGFGLMGLTWRNGPVPSQEQAFDTMRAALKLGGKPINLPLLSSLTLLIIH
jgi:pyridoxine 4-dehydrogenase